MGFVIKLSNLIVNYKNTFKGSAENFSAVYSSNWDRFVEGELEPSNERNSRSLGGKPTSTASDDDDQTQHFDVNMDNIMKRFKCFTTIMQNNSSTDDDKDDEDETLNEPDREEDTETKPSEGVKIEVLLPEAETIDAKYSDSGYWKVDVTEDELDDLLADYE